MEQPLTIALLLLLGFNRGVVLMRVFGPPETPVSLAATVSTIR